jgi:surfactin synthase thioesterase subunit
MTRLRGLVASFPAAGSGGTTLEQLEKTAVSGGLDYLALANPASAGAFESGAWARESVDQIRQAVRQAVDGYLILAGHCMGGLSAVHLAQGLSARLSLPVRVLVINTPCPDAQGAIPTMTHLSDGEIAQILMHDGFPQDLLDDEDMLAEIADRLRAEAAVADRIAEWVSSAAGPQTLHVLSTRGDTFTPPAACSGWQHRVPGEFQLTIADGGHAIDETTSGLLERTLRAAVASVAGSVGAEPE